MLSDLAAEQDALDAVVADLPAGAWTLPTPSPGWTVADQVGHLTYFDNAARTAVVDPDGFAVMRDELMATFGEEVSADDLTLAPYRAMAPGELLAAWREGRAELVASGQTLADDDRVDWYGPSMGAKSFYTARLMECWAHGQDVIDAVEGVEEAGIRGATDRLRHIAQLGVITRGWSYLNRGMEVPEGEVHVRLDAPSGDEWTWGGSDAEDRVEGAAEDFCLVVTQRRNVADTELVVGGPLAEDWMQRAQAFAGPPTDGPVPTGAP